MFLDIIISIASKYSLIVILKISLRPERVHDQEEQGSGRGSTTMPVVLSVILLPPTSQLDILPGLPGRRTNYLG